MKKLLLLLIFFIVGCNQHQPSSPAAFFKGDFVSVKGGENKSSGYIIETNYYSSYKSWYYKIMFLEGNREYKEEEIILKIPSALLDQKREINPVQEIKPEIEFK
jgi:hypothetical protein